MKCLYLTFGSRITIGSLSDIKNSKKKKKNARLIGAKTIRIDELRDAINGSLYKKMGVLIVETSIYGVKIDPLYLSNSL